MKLKFSIKLGKIKVTLSFQVLKRKTKKVTRRRWV